MRKVYLTSLAALAFAASANAQTVLHYWDFESMNEVVGGLSTIAVGTVDLSVHATYGEAYTGSGQTLNSVTGGTGVGGGFLEADVHDGANATALDFGTSNFSISYWSYNPDDGDVRGPRIFDCLAGTTFGVQLGTNLTGDWNLRVGDDLGGTTISPPPVITQGLDAWTQVCVNVDRGNNQVEVFFNGASQGTISLVDGISGLPLTGSVFPTIDLQIGVINGGTVAGQSQDAGLDDLAFYDGLLDAADIAALASGAVTPLSFGGTADFCNGDGGDQMGCTDCPCGNNAAQGTIGGCLNSAITSTRLLVSGTSSIGAADLRIEASGAPPSVSAVLTSGNAQAPANMANPCFGSNSGIQSVSLDGLRCAVQNVLRHGVRPSDTNGDIGVTTNGWGDPNGFFNFGAFSAGQTKHFQIIYRDDDMLVCQTGQNTSQGSSVTFQP